MADDEAPKPEPETTRNKLVVGVVVIAIGMGLVALAFRLRWEDSDELMHPFPFFLGIGTLVVFAATRASVHAVAALYHMRKGGRGE